MYYVRMICFSIFYLIYESYFRKHFPNATHFHDYNRYKCKNIHISYRIVKYALHPYMPKQYFNISSSKKRIYSVYIFKRKTNA